MIKYIGLQKWENMKHKFLVWVLLIFFFWQLCKIVGVHFYQKLPETTKWIQSIFSWLIHNWHSWSVWTFCIFSLRNFRLKLEKNILWAPQPPSSAWMQLTELCLFTPIWFSTVHAQVSVNINYFYQSLQCAEWLVKRVYCKRQMKMRVQGQVAVGDFFFFFDYWEFRGKASHYEAYWEACYSACHFMYRD